MGKNNSDNEWSFIERNYKEVQHREDNTNMFNEYHRGMQKAITDMISAYLMSEEATQAGVCGLEISKVRKPFGVTIKSSFLLSNDGFMEDEEDEDDYTEEDDEHYEEAEDIMNDIANMIRDWAMSQDEGEEDEKPKRRKKSK